jgi:hypothetical protein
MEFLRVMVEERFAKMEKLGEKWDDAPVRYFLIVLVSFNSCHGDIG